ncbi:DUF2914 domain-containing protein [Candidatus Uhrbacteria bacterium]|nr:DUF2914 domain-containing protein [Candidatus Uhrbacteria bacterium]
MLTTLKSILRFHALKRIYTKHERRLVPAMLLGGIMIDVITFRSINLTTAFTILGIYTLLCAAMITVIHHYDATRGLLERPTFLGYLRLVAPLIVQFTFGALLSAALIFYWFSGSFSVSWPFLLIVVVLMTANDVLREHYLRPTVQLSVFYFVLFATLAVAIPSLIGSISPIVFIIAGVVSLGLMSAYLFLLYRLRPDLRFMRPSPLISVASIFLLMNAAYFLNIIPPIPLSLVDAGAYYSVERQGSEYVLISQDESWVERLSPTQHLQVSAGERVYVYASIFAPVDLHTTIAHDWQYFTPQGWQSVSRLSYTIVGGRQDGYRGYSYITSHRPGKWRVDVETPRGQVIGRVVFVLEEPN